MNTPNPWYRPLVELLFGGPETPCRPDAVSIYRAAIAEIAGLRAKLTRQSEQLALALKKKNEIVGEWIKAKQQMATLQDENTKLALELAKWKPPDPKFRPGQILMAQANQQQALYPIRVLDRRLTGDKTWEYKSTYSGDWYDEAQCRILKPEEI